MTVLSTSLSPLRLALTLLRRLLVGLTPWRRQVNVSSQTDLARLVERTSHHQLRVGKTHRFIDLMYVTVGDRVFCRRYTFREPSWHSALRDKPEGQVRLDGTVVDIEGRVPDDLDPINLAVNRAYEQRLHQLGAPFMVAGAVEDRAMASTVEIVFSHKEIEP